jgi:hypothetical protein
MINDSVNNVNDMREWHQKHSNPDNTCFKTAVPAKHSTLTMWKPNTDKWRNKYFYAYAIGKMF